MTKPIGEAHAYISVAANMSYDAYMKTYAWVRLTGRPGLWTDDACGSMLEDALFDATEERTTDL